MKRKPLFDSEAAMCAAFIDWAHGFDGWTAYPETHDWDILMAHSDGTQIGIQAKLKLNIPVLSQTVAGWHDWHSTGPDFRAILVPDRCGCRDLCEALGIVVFSATAPWYENRRIEFEPKIEGRRSYQLWHFQNPAKRLVLPRYIPDVPAGVPSPSALTEWKISALEIMATMALRGYVTREDFKRAGIDHRRWTQNWLEPDLKSGAWRRGKDCPDFAAQHPIVYPQVLADMRERLAASELALK